MSGAAVKAAALLGTLNLSLLASLVNFPQRPPGSHQPHEFWVPAAAAGCSSSLTSPLSCRPHYCRSRRALGAVQKEMVLVMGVRVGVVYVAGTAEYVLCGDAQRRAAHAGNAATASCPARRASLPRSANRLNRSSSSESRRHSSSLEISPQFSYVL